MVLTDPNQPGNPIVFANQPFTDLSGYTLDEVLGQQPHFMDGEGTDNLDAARFRQILDRDEDGVVETVQYRKDGSRFVATVLLSAFKDAAGKTLYHFLSWSDVTRQTTAERQVVELRAKHAEDELRGSEERLGLAIQVGMLATWDWDLRTGVVEWNDRHFAIQGYAVNEVKPSFEAWLARVHPEDRTETLGLIEKARIGKEEYVHEFRSLHADGSVVWCSARGRFFYREDGDPLRMIGVMEDITRRKNVEHALRESKERLRLIVESARDYAIFTMDTERNIEHWLPGAEAVFGWMSDEIEGKSADVLFTPEDRANEAPKTETDTALRDGQAPDVRWHLNKDGHRVFIEGQSVPLFEGGKHSGFLKIGQDVTSRRAEREALQQSEERLRQFGEASQDVLWTRDPDTLQWTYLTPAFEAIYGVSREEAVSGNNFDNWIEMILPEDREGALASIEKVRQGERITFEYRILRPTDGAVRWLRDTDFPIFDEAGRVARIGGIGQDITEDKETADRMAVLVAELQHRTRNLMGVVRSTARRTAETSSDLLDFRDRFADRIEALARVQGLLSRLGDTDRVSLDALIGTELKAMHGSADRVTLIGPRGVRLRSSMVQPLAMALHELATNAVKYGALGQQSGHLAITWKMVDPDVRGRPRLYIEWKESGVEMPVRATKAQGGGQGRELIEKALPYQLNAETSFEFGPDGIRCTILIPVSESNQREPTDG